VVLLAVWAVCQGGKKKKKSEYTQKDWDRIAREWEREEIEEEEREEKANRRGLKFDPSGNVDSIMAQAKHGKPTMIFFTLKEKDCPSMKALEQVSQRYASMLLSGHVPVQNYPVGERRSIFMTKEGSQMVEIKNFLLKQPEVENVSIDNRVYTPDTGSEPLAPEDPIMRKILGQAPLSDKEMAKIKAKKAKEAAEVEAQPVGDLPTAPDFPHDPTTGKIDIKKFEKMGGKLMTEEEAAMDERTDEEFMKDYQKNSGLDKNDPLLKEMMENKPVLDQMAMPGGDDEMMNEDIVSPEDVSQEDDPTLKLLNANDQSLSDQAEDFIKNSGLGRDDPLIKQMIENTPNIKSMKVMKEESENVVKEEAVVVVKEEAVVVVKEEAVVVKEEDKSANTPEHREQQKSANDIPEHKEL